jgi:hypothetical protein
LREGVRDRLRPAGAESCQQGFEALAIVVADGNKLQTEAAAALYVTNDGVGFDAPLLNEKVEFCRHTLFHAEMRSFDEQAIDTDVQDARDVVASIAAPADPDIL